MKSRLAVASFPALLAAVAIAAAGCGGSSSGGSASASPGGGSGGGASATKAGSATVDVANNPQLGRILVDAQGNTLYTFQNDTGTRSTCNGQCAKFWPPLVASGKPSAGNGASAGMLGTSKRSDGSMQVTYAGRPLYTYASDSAPGQVNGNGINSSGGVWNAVQPSGAKAPSGTGSSGGGSAGSSSGGGSAGSSSGGGGGYGY